MIHTVGSEWLTGGEGEAVNVFRPGGFHGDRAFVQRAACGRNVVHNKNGRARPRLAMGDAECAAQVVGPLFYLQTDLRTSVSVTKEGVRRERDFELFCYHAGDTFCLIVTTQTTPVRVHGARHHIVEC